VYIVSKAQVNQLYTERGTWYGKTNR
jgi:hypothetical protein